MTPETRRSSHPRNYFVTAAFLILAGLLLGLGLSAALDLQKPSLAERTSSAPDAVVAAAPSAAALPESPFVAVVDKALPAVVFIDVRKDVSASVDDQDDLLRRFFGDGRSRNPQTRPSSGRVSSSIARATSSPTTTSSARPATSRSR
jgi:S1-C subfamily serine protease